jgi:hypothetical protein
VWIPVAEEKTETEIHEEADSYGAIYPAYQAPHESSNCHKFYLMP